MNSKYVMIRGFAFSEEDDMEKLKGYAKKGWILEGIAGGIFYKLRKDKPQSLVYSLDYQTETNEEYFTIFKEAGWNLVVSTDCMHIFSAKEGTMPIYSDRETEVDKYTSIRNQTRKGTLYSFVIAIALMALLACSIIIIRPAFLFILGVLLIDLCVFIFNFLPYLAYNSRIKQIQKYGKCNSKVINNKAWWKLDVLMGVLWVAMGIWHLHGKLYYSSAFFIIGGVFFIFTSLVNFKKYKASL